MRIAWGDKAHSKTSYMSQYLVVLLTGVYSLPRMIWILAQGADITAFSPFFFTIFLLSCARVITIALAKDTPTEESEVVEAEITEETEETTEITEEVEAEETQTDEEQKEN
jgi:hypothetical protein